MVPDTAKELTGRLIRAMRVHPTTRDLSENAFRILGRTFYLAFLHGMRSISGAIFSVPSQKYLAKAAGVHRVTVARIVSTLKSRSLLNVARRRPVKGRWTTNLYKVGSLVWILFGNIIKGLTRGLDHVARALHIVSETKKYNNTIQKKSDFSHKLKSKEWSDIEKDFYNRHPELV